MSDAVDIDALLPKGTLLSGKYEVVRVIGRGGMGVVVEARHLRMARNVAIKILLPAQRAQRDVVTRFEREARAAAQIKDEHVARVLDVDTLPDGSPFIVMELLRGKDLQEILTDRGKLPYREAAGFVMQACAGMVDAHRAGVVHRDLKPNNLFLDQQGGRQVLKILDFGISKVTDESGVSMTATTSAFGTPLYMSPEQVRSTKNVDARSDIWSLGVVLYELIAGEPPYMGPSAPAIIAAIIADKPVPILERCPDLPPGLAEVIGRAMEKDPNARYQDVQSFAAALAPYGPEGSAHVPMPTMPPPSVVGAANAATNPPAQVTTAPRPAGVAHPLLPVALGVGLAFVLGGVMLFTVLRPKPRTPAAADPVAGHRPDVTATASATAPVVAPAESAPQPVATPTATAAPTTVAATVPPKGPSSKGVPADKAPADKVSPDKPPLDKPAPEKAPPDKPPPDKQPPAKGTSPPPATPPKPPADDPRYL
ncbi:MAG: serine/threonine-protein kinase [Minicystis sp.]